MPVVPVRDLAAQGIIKDQNPFDLGLNAWSGGTNVRFGNKKAMRAPVFRKVVSGFSDTSPRHCVGYRPATGFDSVFIASTTGAISRYVAGDVVDVSPAGFAPHESDIPWTNAFLGDVLYLNRETDVPMFWGPTSNKFAPIPAWDAGWRCRSLRPYKDFLIALNVTKGAVENQSMVKWSDLTLAGQPPASWDQNNKATSAGESVLAELDSEIVDGLPLKSVFVIYSRSQVWLMEHVGGQFIFNFRKVFSEGGIINNNCVVEVEGKHFVFGTNDLYMHDGTVKQSICDQRIKEYVFRTMNNRLNNRFFVAHNPALTEIMFCFVSGDPDVKYPNPTRCNKAAVYNYSNNTWGLMDLPNVASITVANINHYLTYEKAVARYDLVGGSYYDQDDGFANHVVAVSAPMPEAGLNGSKVLGVDLMDKGALSYELDPECYAPAFVERVGIDLDEAGSDLRTFKSISRLFPQVTIFRNIPVQIQVGASETPAGNVKWGRKQAFDPYKQYKVDYRSSGRYLAIRFFVDEPADFEISGFDAEIITGGRR